MKNLSVPYHKQKNSYFCGPAVLQMVLEYFDHIKSQDDLAKEISTNPKEGSAVKELITAALKKGFYCYVNDNSTLFEIQHHLKRGLPVIVNYLEHHGNEGHYSIITGITFTKIIMNDPWHGKKFKLSKKKFLDRWRDTHNIYKKWIMVIAKDDTYLGKQYKPKNPN